MAELRKNSENQKENTFLFELVGREVLLYYKTCNLGFARCGQRGELSGHTVYTLPHRVVIVDGDVAVPVGMVVQQLTEFVHHLIDDLRGR